MFGLTCKPLMMKQVRTLFKWFAISFLWAFFQRFFTASGDCGFASFPTFAGYPFHIFFFLLQDQFDPIVDATTGQDLIPAMVYGSIGDQDFGRMYCAVLMVGSIVVSAGILRIFGRDTAEIPLVATTSDNQGRALDFVISEARRYRIKLVLSLVNNYNDYGGRAQYVQWARNAGVQVNNDDDFYTNAIIKKYYKHHVKRVLTRFNTITKMAYKDDSTIMAWELMNEPRCQTDTSGRTLHGWIQEMARYVKSIDNKHLVEIGMEGFYGDSTPRKKRFNPGYQVGTDFVKSNRIREIDFATMHAYPDIWLKGQSDKYQLKWVNRWMQRHWRDAKMIIGKPLVFAEFGKSKKDPGYSLGGRNSFLTRVYNNMYRDTRSGGAFDGGMVWQVVAAGMESYHDGYEIVLPQNPLTTAVISAQSHRMTDLAAHSHIH